MRIVIAGAGIAGLVGALALARPGRDISLYERRTGFGESGAGIQLSPNATRVLLDLGLGGALARIAFAPEAVVIRAIASGREIGRVGFGAAARSRYGTPFLTVARADLHALLLDAVRAKSQIRLRIGRAIASFREQDGIVRVGTEASGGTRQDVEADCLIGADGIGSAIRIGLGDPRRPVEAGYAAYRTTLPAGSEVARAAGPNVGLWLGSGRHVVHYPIADGLNVVVVARAPERIEGWSAPVDAGSMAAVLAGACPPLRRLTDAAGSWSAWSLRDLPARILGRGRVALIGDAAHPLLPYLAQGGSLAIEDAAHLGALLGPDPATAPDAIARYGHERIARVRRVQAEARRNGRVYHAAGPVAFARDLVIGRLGPDRMRDRSAWLYAWRAPDESA